MSHLVAEGEGIFSRPLISSDGNLVAYLVAGGADLGPDFRHSSQIEQLWVANTNGSGQRLLVSADEVSSDDPHWVSSPRSFAWRAGTHSLVFNTRSLQVPPGECCPWDLRDDLWMVDADSGVVTQLLANGDGGNFSLSPDGRYAAISRPEDVGLYDFDSADLPQTFTVFSRIWTYSEYAYKPSVSWSPDSTFFSVVVPSEDPVSPDANAALYRVRVDGTLELQRTLPGNFVFNSTSWDDYPQPKVSPDGRYVVYGRFDLNGFSSLRLIDVGKTNDAVVDWRPLLLLPLSWSPDSQRFVYLALPDGRFRAGEGMVVALDGHTQSLTADVIYEARWLGQGILVIHAQIEDQKGLYAQSLDGDTWLLISGLNEQAEFDVIPLE